MENTEIMNINEVMENEEITTESCEKEAISGGVIGVLALAAIGGAAVIKTGIDIGKKVGPKIGAKVKGIFKKDKVVVEAEATEEDVEVKES